MGELDNEIIKLREQTWKIARESIEINKLTIYRTLNDIAEKLTTLIDMTDNKPVVADPEGKFVPIFARYRGEKYEAQLDVARIFGGKCIWMDGEWLAPSHSAINIKKNSTNPPYNHTTNGWGFWKYFDESSNSEQPIDRLRGKS